MGNDLLDEIFLAAQPLVMLSGVQVDNVYLFAGQQSEISTVVAEVSGTRTPTSWDAPFKRLPNWSVCSVLGAVDIG